MSDKSLTCLVGDPEDESTDSPENLPSALLSSKSEAYCSNNRDVGLAGQIGLLYVTPVGLSISSTVDTEKTATLSLGYQF
ncbi:hypothetical protein [Psychromonas sp. Urea-02u-13]|uniref:hypothetical protein n=1 Tax=Psychromonas sp. Urea-02u-13 TaxID=2058326 RepID=UPI000C34030B|nr:hypothetical protein [Psychromonas sp. Urea-02u-13]PKG40914.1 hypothetical protein CXF74_00930 [Psychromonas sp. Urea-02u-13]